MSRVVETMSHVVVRSGILVQNFKKSRETNVLCYGLKCPTSWHRYFVNVSFQGNWQLRPHFASDAVFDDSTVISAVWAMYLCNKKQTLKICPNKPRSSHVHRTRHEALEANSHLEKPSTKRPVLWKQCLTLWYGHAF